MASQTTFDLSQIQRALGMKTGVSLPAMEAGKLVQTMVVGDMSKSFAAEQFEARGFATGFASFHATQFSFAQIIANAPGGIVIERVDIKANDPLNVPIDQIGIRTGFPTGLLGPIDGITFNVGGAPLSSKVTGGNHPVRPTEAIVALDAIGHKTFENFSWFIPSGSAFEVGTRQVNEVVIVNMQWREIPQAPGSQ